MNFLFVWLLLLLLLLCCEEMLALDSLDLYEYAERDEDMRSSRIDEAEAEFVLVSSVDSFGNGAKETCR